MIRCKLRNINNKQMLITINSAYLYIIYVCVTLVTLNMHKYRHTDYFHSHHCLHRNCRHRVTMMSCRVNLHRCNHSWRRCNHMQSIHGNIHNCHSSSPNNLKIKTQSEIVVEKIKLTTKRVAVWLFTNIGFTIRQIQHKFVQSSWQWRHYQQRFNKHCPFGA